METNDNMSDVERFRAAGCKPVVREISPPRGRSAMAAMAQEQGKKLHTWAKLRTMTEEEATANNYVSICTKFDPTAEPDVVESMERSMKGIDAVWIVAVSNFRTLCEMARRSWEINKLVDEVGRTTGGKRDQ